MKPTGRILALWLMLTSLLAGCGFHLRNQADIPFSSIYLQAPASSAVATSIRHMMIFGGHPERLATSPTKAERILEIQSENEQMIILALTATGLVSEYQLQLDIKYRLLMPDGKEALPPTKIHLTRDMAYNASQPYAYGDEEQFLYRDMQTDAAQQILRRLSMMHN